MGMVIATVASQLGSIQYELKIEYLINCPFCERELFRMSRDREPGRNCVSRADSPRMCPKTSCIRELLVVQGKPKTSLGTFQKDALFGSKVSTQQVGQIQ